MNKLDIYITLIIIVKVIFILLAIYGTYTKHKKNSDKKLVEKIEFWKERFEFIFIAMMSVLLIYLFNPRENRLNLITSETRILLYLFGFILIITAKWQLFIGDSPLLKQIQSHISSK